MKIDARVSENGNAGVEYFATPVTIRLSLAPSGASTEIVGTVGQIDGLRTRATQWLSSQLGQARQPATQPVEELARQLAGEEIAAMRALMALNPWCDWYCGRQADEAFVGRRILAYAMRAAHLDPTDEEAARVIAMLSQCLYFDPADVDWSLTACDRGIVECQQYLSRFKLSAEQRRLALTKLGLLCERAADITAGSAARRRNPARAPIDGVYRYLQLSVRANAEWASAYAIRVKDADNLWATAYMVMMYLLPHTPDEQLQSELAYWRQFWKTNVKTLNLPNLPPEDFVEIGFFLRTRNYQDLRACYSRFAQTFGADDERVWGRNLDTMRRCLHAAGDPEWKTRTPVFALAGSDVFHPKYRECEQFMRRLNPPMPGPADALDSMLLPGVQLVWPDEVRLKGKTANPICPAIQALGVAGQQVWCVTPGLDRVQSQTVSHRLLVFAATQLDCAGSDIHPSVVELPWPAHHLDGGAASPPKIIQHWLAFSDADTPTVVIATRWHGAAVFGCQAGAWTGRWLTGKQGLPTDDVRDIAVASHQGPAVLIMEGLGELTRPGDIGSQRKLRWRVDLSTLQTTVLDPTPQPPAAASEPRSPVLNTVYVDDQVRFLCDPPYFGPGVAIHKPAATPRDNARCLLDHAGMQWLLPDESRWKLYVYLPAPPASADPQQQDQWIGPLAPSGGGGDFFGVVPVDDRRVLVTHSQHIELVDLIRLRETAGKSDRIHSAAQWRVHYYARLAAASWRAEARQAVLEHRHADAIALLESQLRQMPSTTANSAEAKSNDWVDCTLSLALAYALDGDVDQSAMLYGRIVDCPFAEPAARVFASANRIKALWLATRYADMLIAVDQVTRMFPDTKPHRDDAALNWYVKDATAKAAQPTTQPARPTVDRRLPTTWPTAFLPEPSQALTAPDPVRIAEMVRRMQSPGQEREGEYEAARIGKPAVQSLIPLLKHENHSVRRAVASALGRIGKDAGDAAPALIAAMDDPVVRADAVYTFRALGDRIQPATARILSYLTDRSQTVETRWRAGLTLIDAAPDTEGLVAALMSNLKADPDPSVRRYAVQALSQLRAAASLPLLGEALRDPDSEVRWFAISALGFMGAGEQQIPAIAALLRDENKNTRLFAAQTLGQSASKAKTAIPSLTHALADPDSQVRLMAAQTLEVIGRASDVARARLVEVQKHDSVPEVRSAAENAIHAIDESFD